MPLWAVSHFPTFNSFQEHTNEVEQKQLAQKKKNFVNYIFGHFYQMLWWESKARSGSTTYSFEEETDYSKIPIVLSGNLAQLNAKFENNMTGCTKEIKKWLQLTMNIIKRKEIFFIVENLNCIRNKKSNSIT